MKLLIAYDGSDCSDAALFDLRLAGLPNEAQAVVISVAEGWLPPGRAPEACPPDEILGLTTEPSQAREVAEHGCDQLRSIFPEWDARAEGGCGSPAKEILQRAESWNPDLIVLGARGLSTLERVLIGSVSQSVATGAPCSVRVGRGRMPAERRPVKLVIGLDDTPEANELIRVVAGRAWPPGSEVTLVTAIAAGLIAGSHRDSALGRIEMLQAEAARSLREAGLECHRVTSCQDPKRILLAEADEIDADCLFVGSRSRVKRLLLGSVAGAVAVRASCSVEIVRARPRASGDGE